MKKGAHSREPRPRFEVYVRKSLLDRICSKDGDKPYGTDGLHA